MSTFSPTAFVAERKQQTVQQLAANKRVETIKNVNRSPDFKCHTTRHVDKKFCGTRRPPLVDRFNEIFRS